MSDPYVDHYTTLEQRSRDKAVTELLNEYVSVYKEKSKSNQFYKKILFGSNCGILVLFSLSLPFLIYKIFSIENTSYIPLIIELVSVCITFLLLIMGLLQTITKYVFPEKEDEYITRIVEIIQNNDLENKKENIRAQREKFKTKSNFMDFPNTISEEDGLEPYAAKETE